MPARRRGLWQRMREAVSKRRPQIARIKFPGLAIVRNPTTSASSPSYEPPTFDLMRVHAAYHTDSFVRRALDKYTELVLKEGYELTSANPEALEYIRTRLRYMSIMTGMPFDQFLSQTTQSYVRYANAILVKARVKPNAFPGLKVQGINGKDPVGGYFLLPPWTVTIARKANGEVVKYQQSVPGQDPIEFSPEDVVHMRWQPEIGHAFGVPLALTVVDDVIVLREIEDNINRLIYRYLHPLLKVLLGRKDDDTPPLPEEITMVQNTINNMDPDNSTLILPARYIDVDVIGAAREALDVEWAVKYFRERVLVGLGVPAVVLGIEASANRSTADQLSSEMHDSVRAIQRSLASYINNSIIMELLMEGGYDPISNPDDMVTLTFREIALDEQIKRENHAIEQWNNNAITFEELRQALGRSALDDEAMQRLRAHLIEIPVALAKAEAAIEAAANSVSNKDRPANQHGKKLSPKRTSARWEAQEADRDGSPWPALEPFMAQLRADLLQLHRAQASSALPDLLEALVRRVLQGLEPYLVEAIRQGVAEAQAQAQARRTLAVPVLTLYRLARRQAEADVRRIVGEWHSLLESSWQDGPSGLQGAVDVLGLRLRYWSVWHEAASRHRAFAYAAYAMGYDQLAIRHEASEPCAACASHEAVLPLKMPEVLAKLPPYHPFCSCRLQLLPRQGKEA